MDIIMPNLDGCSAAHFIRQSDSQTPIIAMTANVRGDDVQVYYHNGSYIAIWLISIGTNVEF